MKVYPFVKAEWDYSNCVYFGNCCNYEAARVEFEDMVQDRAQKYRCVTLRPQNGTTVLLDNKSYSPDSPSMSVIEDGSEGSLT